MSAPCLLKVESLTVQYGSRLALQGVDLDLPAGQVHALIGPNGAGKSTLVRAVSGVIPAHAGRIQVAGLDLGHLGAARRARLLAVVPQARNLPPAFTVWETVLLGRTPHLNWLGQTSPQDEERARLAMQRTDTLCLAKRRVGELSGGEQQRVLIARALAQSAPLLILDEPTAHLDLQYQVSLLTLIRDLAHQDGYAILIVLHDLNLVDRYADQVTLLVQGVVQAQGRPEEVFDAQQLSAAYHTPLQVYHNGPGSQRFVAPAPRG
jgi:iron complex transport system ATP-binding protein